MYNIIIRGGGDTATAIAWYLFKANFRNLIILEKEKPTSIRREVCFSSAIYEGEKIVEGIKAVKCNKDIDFGYRDLIPVIIDEKGELLNKKNVDIVIDAILSKRKRRNYDDRILSHYGDERQITDFLKEKGVEEVIFVNEKEL